MERLQPLTNEQYDQLEATELMRMLASLACTHGADPADYYRARWASSPLASSVTKMLTWSTKAAVPPGTTTDATWAAPLTARLTGGFLALVRKASVIGQLGVTPVPFATPMLVQIAGASCRWVGQGSPKPVTTLGFGSVTLSRLKGGGVVVVTRELMTFAAPGSELAVQQILTNELTTFIDGTFLSTAAATPASPAGILAGVVASADVNACLSAFFAARPAAVAPTWILSPAAIGKLAPAETTVPGRFRGFPLVLSPSAGPNVILVDAPAVSVADDGLELDVSDQALVQMDSAPTDPPTAATIMTSLWQDNLVGIRVERFINWQVPTGAVQYFVTT